MVTFQVLIQQILDRTLRVEREREGGGGGEKWGFVFENGKKKYEFNLTVQALRFRKYISTIAQEYNA